MPISSPKRSRARVGATRSSSSNGVRSADQGPQDQRLEHRERSQPFVAAVARRCQRHPRRAWQPGRSHPSRTGRARARAQRERDRRELRGQKLDPSRQQGVSRVQVSPEPGALGASPEMLCCASREREAGIVDRPQLGAVPVRLLEVVADDLVALDAVRRRARPASRRTAHGARPGSPSAARRMRRPGSGCGGSGRRRRPRTARSPAGRAPCEPEPPAAPSPRPSACTAPRWNTCPSTAPRSSTLRSSPSSWSSRAASSA